VTYNADIANMKNNKAAGPPGFVLEMLKASVKVGPEWVADMCTASVKDGNIPECCSKSWLASMYKGKGDALECGLYQGIKMLGHALKIFERIIEVRVREKVYIDIGFMGGKGTTYTILIVRQLKVHSRKSKQQRKKDFGWHSLIWKKHLTEYLARWSGGR